jgi:hypothetical protein
VLSPWHRVCFEIGRPLSQRQLISLLIRPEPGYHFTAMPILTPFAQITSMFVKTKPQVRRGCHADSRPLLQTICHSLRVRRIQGWFARRVAALAGLVIYSCIVVLVGILSYRDGDLLAGPDGQACCVAAVKSTHDVGVVVIYAAVIVVRLVEAKGKVVVAKEVRHFIME